jgi:hypothetical protein
LPIAEPSIRQALPEPADCGDRMLGTLHRDEAAEEDDRRVLFFRDRRDVVRRRALGNDADVFPAVQAPQ